jgi:hypothetical protein
LRKVSFSFSSVTKSRDLDYELSKSSFAIARATLRQSTAADFLGRELTRAILHRPRASFPPLPPPQKPNALTICSAPVTRALAPPLLIGSR